MTARTDLQVSVDATLVLLSRLGGGPVLVSDEAIVWAAKRLDLLARSETHGYVELRFTCSDGDVVDARAVTMSDAFGTLVDALSTPERYRAAKAKLDVAEADSGVELLDPGSFVDPEEQGS